VKIGFIGLGKMGRPMALNLLKAGFPVTVHNRSRGVVEELGKAGAHQVFSPRDVAEECDIVLTCLPNSKAVEEVYLGKEGAISHARRGQIFIDHSTVGPSTSGSLARAAGEKGASFLDAPISGGPVGAETGTLTIMVGGEKDAFDKAKPVLEAMGKNIHHVGSSGAGSVVKLANQLLVAINLSGLVEALVMGAKAGVDPNMMMEVLGTSYGGSVILNRLGPLLVQRNFQARTPVNLILKDLGLIKELSDELSLRLLMGSLAEEIFSEAKAQGYGEQDMVALVRPLEELAGVEVKSPVGG